MKNLTTLERQALDSITKDDFYENGLDSVIWADVFLDSFKGYYSVTPEKARGVLSSLVQKGIIHPILKGRDGTIAFTNKGKDLMIKLGYPA